MFILPFEIPGQKMVIEMKSIMSFYYYIAAAPLGELRIRSKRNGKPILKFLGFHHRTDCDK